VKLDRDRLVKLLNLTDSEHDAEALAAVRKSNELLRLNGVTWHAVLGLPPAAGDGAERPAPPRAPDLPPGHAFARDYRNAFRREPVVARLLAFPFWLALELLALVAPRLCINKRGRPITLVFVLSLVLSATAWIAAGYYLVFVLAA
jgi:hypothetical protein